MDKLYVGNNKSSEDEDEVEDSESEDDEEEEEEYFTDKANNTSSSSLLQQEVPTQLDTFDAVNLSNTLLTPDVVTINKDKGHSSSTSRTEIQTLPIFSSPLLSVGTSSVLSSTLSTSKVNTMTWEVIQPIFLHWEEKTKNIKVRPSERMKQILMDFIQSTHTKTEHEAREAATWLTKFEIYELENFQVEPRITRSAQKN
jgi:hypothetical protein